MQDDLNCNHDPTHDAGPTVPRPVLLMRELSKVFTTKELETYALSGINLSVNEGEFLAITGPSGCGKSTLLSVMGLLEPPTRGELFVAGQDTINLTLTQRAHLRNRWLGFVFQDFNLIGDMSVLDNVALPLAYRGVPPAGRKELATQAIERVNMLSRLRHLPSQLSGGQQQRVAIARAIVGQPTVLLADEPTGNLDSSNSQAVMDLISEIHDGGTTICMVSHDARFVASADRVIALLDGRVVDNMTAA